MGRKKKKIKTSKRIKNILVKEILGAFRKNPKKPLNYKQVCAALFVEDDEQKQVIRDLLEELSNSGKLVVHSAGKYLFKEQHDTVRGTVDFSSRGAAFVSCEEFERDVFISPKNTGQALQGDEVEVVVFPSRKGRPEGEIKSVIKRARTNFVGVIQRKENFSFFVPDNIKISVDFFIPNEYLNGAKDGQKVVAKIKDWPNNAKSPVGIVTDVLGYPGENEVEIHSIISEYGLPDKFPTKVMSEAQELSGEITKQEEKIRRDFRNVLTFTIDPDDAKDFDDALSYRALENGHIELGIHIADVSHFVQPGTLLDKEAFKRGNSVYLVDRVIPMLPEEISNIICSLRPNEDKYCFSAVFELDNNGNVQNEWFGKTIIHSDKRFTYEQAQEIIEKTNHDEHYSPVLLTIDSLAKKLRKKRIDNGALNIESKEVKFVLDEESKPLGVKLKISKDANKLIEEFMLLANKRVAKKIGSLEKLFPFVYRVHDLPDEEKLNALKLFVKKFGFRINITSEMNASSAINDLLAELKDSPYKDIIEPVAIRSMSKAYYSTINIGHYGLAFDYYTHFTSPIRRYPDLLVHRLLMAYLSDKKGENKKALEEQCKHCSTTERSAIDAERASVKYMQVVYLQDKIGEEFEGVVSGVTEWGIFVELVENKCEGLVAIKSLPDDYYYYDEENFTIKGYNTKKEFFLGQKLQVKLVNADLQKKQLDFTVVEEDDK